MLSMDTRHIDVEAASDTSSQVAEIIGPRSSTPDGYTGHFYQDSVNYQLTGQRDHQI